jgi:hypothetical protein
MTEETVTMIVRLGGDKHPWERATEMLQEQGYNVVNPLKPDHITVLSDVFDGCMVFDAHLTYKLCT